MWWQTIAPDPDISCQPGWCLQYVRQAFGLPARYGTATEAWEKSPTQHRDAEFPPGVWHPVWYGLDGEPAGHVVLRAPNGSVYSTSDLGSTPHLHPDLADLERYYTSYGMPLRYRGWTEDVAGWPVISPINRDEDDMAEADVQAITASVNFAFQRLLTELPGLTAAATVAQPVPYYEPRTGKQLGTTSLGTMAGYRDLQDVASRDALAAIAGAAGPDAEAAAQAAYAKFLDELAKIQITVAVPDAH